MYESYWVSWPKSAQYFQPALKTNGADSYHTAPPEAVWSRSMVFLRHMSSLSIYGVSETYEFSLNTIFAYTYTW